MGNIDDEFQKMVEGLSDIDKEVPIETSNDGEYQTFSSLFLVESLGHLSRSLAFLIEFMEVSMDHMAHRSDQPRPALTKSQVDVLRSLFESSASFNQSVMHGPEEDDGDSLV